MPEHLPQDTTALARALLEVVPLLIRRIHGDVPLSFLAGLHQACFVSFGLSIIAAVVAALRPTH